MAPPFGKRWEISGKRWFCTSAGWKGKRDLRRGADRRCRAALRRGDSCHRRGRLLYRRSAPPCGVGERKARLFRCHACRRENGCGGLCRRLRPVCRPVPRGDGGDGERQADDHFRLPGSRRHFRREHCVGGGGKQLLFPRRALPTAEDLAADIERLMRCDAPTLEKLGAYARKFILQNYSVEKMTNSQLAVYEKSRRTARTAIRISCSAAITAMATPATIRCSPALWTASGASILRLRSA